MMKAIMHADEQKVYEAHERLSDVVCTNAQAQLFPFVKNGVEC